MLLLATGSDYRILKIVLLTLSDESDPVKLSKKLDVFCKHFSREALEVGNSLGKDVKQLCPTEMPYWAKNYVTIFIRAVQ